MKFNLSYIRKNAADLLLIGLITAGMFLIMMALLLKVVMGIRDDMYPGQNIVSVDVNEIVADFINENKARNLDEKQINVLVDQFSSKLSSYIKEKAAKEHLVIVPKQAIIAGGTDYTVDVKKAILKGYK